MTRLLAVVLAWAALASAGASGPPAIPAAAPALVLNGAERQTLEGHLALLEDPSGTLTIQDVTAPSRAGTFRPLPGFLAGGYGEGALWVRFTVSCREDLGRVRWLETGPPFTERVTLYTPGPDGSFRAHEAGQALQSEGRPRPQATHGFELRLPPEGLATYHLRIQSRTARSLSALLWRPEAFAQSAQRSGFLFGGYFGILALLAVAYGIVSLRTRDAAFGIYGAFAAATVLSGLYTSGYARVLLPGLEPTLERILGSSGTALLLGLGTSLFSTVVSYRERHPKADRWILRFAWAVCLVALAFSLTGQNLRVAPYIAMSLLAMLIALPLLALLEALRGHRPAFLYLCAFGPLIVGAGLRMVHLFGFVSNRELAFDALYLGALSHILLMNLPLAQRIRRLQEERDRAQAAILEAAQHREAELEARVAERTAELRQEQAMLRASLERENQLMADQRRFFSVVSHEFKTPLAAMDGAAQLLLLGGPPEREEVVSAAQRIRRGVRSLGDLVETFLSEERLASGGWELHPREVDPKDLLGQVIGSAPPHTQPIVLEAQDLPPTFRCDPQLVAMAVMNLVGNALKYSPEDGVVRLAARSPAPGILCISVSDQGPGIPEELRGHLFEPFRRGLTDPAVPGLGIGLFAVQRIAQLHGGDVALRCEAGQGSTFTLTLKALPTPEAEGPAG